MFSHFSCLQLFASLWTVAPHVPPTMEFSRQEYWSGLPCPPPWDLPYARMELEPLLSPVLAGGLFTTRATQEAPHTSLMYSNTLHFRIKPFKFTYSFLLLHYVLFNVSLLLYSLLWQLALWPISYVVKCLQHKCLHERCLRKRHLRQKNLGCTSYPLGWR